MLKEMWKGKSKHKWGKTNAYSLENYKVLHLNYMM